MSKSNLIGSGRGYGLAGKMLASWIVEAVILILFYEWSVSGTYPVISQEYIIIVVVALVLVVGYNIYKAKFCKRVPRGRGRRQGLFN